MGSFPFSLGKSAKVWYNAGALACWGGIFGKKRIDTMKLVNVGNALKVTCVGFAAGVLLRVVQMLYFFDYDTGFYTDGGVMAWISLALPLATGLLASWMCFRSRRYFGPYVPRKNVMAGVTAVLSGAVLLLSGALQWMDLRLRLAAGGEYVALHGLFLGCCLLFGLVQLFLSVGFFTGKNSLEKARLLYLVGVLWGVAYLILVYVFYAKSSSFVENFFAVLGGVATLLCLFYLCKLFAGVDEEGAAKRAFVAGIFAVVLGLTYSLSNLALLLLGRTYTGEMPPAVQLASMVVQLFLLVFLVSFRKYSLRRTPKGGTEHPVARHSAKRFKVS